MSSVQPEDIDRCLNFQKFSKKSETSPISLLLLVFSAAVSGLVIFGWPVYLVLHKKTKEALRVLGYTFLFCFGILVVIIGAVVLVSK